MTFEEAKLFLVDLESGGIHDHIFGDAEVSWYTEGGIEIAHGYRGQHSYVTIETTHGKVTFKGDQASDLTYAGKPNPNKWTYQ